MDIQDVELYDIVRIKPNKCLYEYERRLIYMVISINNETNIVQLSSLNHKVYFKSSFPNTIGVDVSEIQKIAIPFDQPLQDYIF